MALMRRLNTREYDFVKFWLPALVNGLVTWVLFMVLGETPFVRAVGLSLAVVGVTLSLRRMGALISVVGGLTLALSPAFWSQTGGGQNDPATIVIALFAATATVIAVFALSQRPYIGLGLGIVVFAAMFWSQIGTPRSLRLTGFVVSWLLFVLIDMLLLTNPRPDDAPHILRDARKILDETGAEPARAYHTLGIWLLFTIGVLNDPVLVLLAPALGLSLFLTNTHLPLWYGLAFAAAVLVGLRGISVDYIANLSYLFEWEQWRYGTRWLETLQLVVGQFGWVGLGLAALGLARLSRWYPPLGTTTLMGYTAYGFFALVYTGNDRAVLLMPLFVIQVLWMTYAVFTLSEWMSKALAPNKRIGYYAVVALYSVLPIIMLGHILAT